MIFATYWFCLFAAVFFAVFWLLPLPRLRLAWLLVACVVFHAHFAGAAGMRPIIILAVLTYLAGLSGRRSIQWIVLGLSVGALAFYKYAQFLSVDTLGLVNAGWGRALSQKALALAPAAPPLAISFFSFEFVHYLFDVSHGKAPIRNPVRFGLFAIFFPSLAAGPIKRYESYMPALNEGAEDTRLASISAGLLRVALGFFKKLVIADNLTGAIDSYHPFYPGMPLSWRWAYLGALSLRILFDFSGYSDIAIGLAQMTGIAIPENFAFPYLASNVREFWHRWHISLSTWVRDYVYIPLGGNRHGAARRVAYGLIAFALVGLWHGPSWHYVFWGVYHGVALGVSTTYARLLGPAGAALQAFFQRAWILSWGVTLLFVAFGWLLFFYPTAEAWGMFRLLFSFR
ncbi:MAG TPA: MBOAT family O-acyltransferase [Opitutaceae bacterium]